MEAIYFGSDIGWNREGNAELAKNKSGPWIGADIENGMYVSNAPPVDTNVYVVCVRHCFPKMFIKI